MRKETREWVRKAEHDHGCALRLTGHGFNDAICFHCQQLVEKYLKALLEEKSLHIPKIHNLDALFGLLRALHPELIPHHRHLITLSRYAVALRSPGEWATKRQATYAVRWAEAIRKACRSLLGIRPKRPRRKT
jgi:HEPN domain-containing protein